MLYLSSFALDKPVDTAAPQLAVHCFPGPLTVSSAFVAVVVTQTAVFGDA